MKQNCESCMNYKKKPFEVTERIIDEIFLDLRENCGKWNVMGAHYDNGVSDSLGRLMPDIVKQTELRGVEYVIFEIIRNSWKNRPGQ